MVTGGPIHFQSDLSYTSLVGLGVEIDYAKDGLTNHAFGSGKIVVNHLQG
jgi:hypothetical protein